MCNGVQSYLKDLSNVSITVLLNKDIFCPMWLCGMSLLIHAPMSWTSHLDCKHASSKLITKRKIGRSLVQSLP